MNTRSNTKTGFRAVASLLAIGCLLGALGCLDEIGLAVPEQEQREKIVIRGSVVAKDTAMVSVRVSKLSNFKDLEIPDHISSARVILQDEAGNQLEIPVVAPGLYEMQLTDSVSNLVVRPGKTYQLLVTLADGREYHSSAEPLYPVPQPASVQEQSTSRRVLDEFGDIVDQEYLQFLLTTPVDRPDGQGKAYLKWNFLGTYRFREANFKSPFPPNIRTCYFYEDLNRDKVVLYNGAESRQNILSSFFLLEEKFNYRFAGGFYLSVFQQSLSEKAYEYWQRAGQTVDVSGTFFETTPGKVKGNFHNIANEDEEVFGYFYASEEAVIRLFIPPALNRVKPYCPSNPVSLNDAPAICLDCLIQPRSTLEKPAFWID